MKWPLKSKPIPKSDVPLFNRLYQAARGQGGPDSTIVWTTELPWEPLQTYVQDYNNTHSNFVGTSHLLVQAVGRALAKHSEVNRRVVGRNVFEYVNCNVCLAARLPNSNEVNVIQIHKADKKTVRQISHIVMKKQLAFARETAPECRDSDRFRQLPQWLFRFIFRTMDWMDQRFVLPVWGRVDRLRESVVLVNDFSHKRFPVMRSYKPSRQPGESKPLSVTLGRPEEKVVWVDEKPCARKFAPMTVRVDHRICDGFQLAQFINTVIGLLTEPAKMQPFDAEFPDRESILETKTSPMEQRHCA